MSKNRQKKLGWHFLPISMRLGYCDNRKAAVGETLSMLISRCARRARRNNLPRPCVIGMHASENLEDALVFASKGDMLCRVLVADDIASDSSDLVIRKFCGRRRKVIWAKRLTNAVLEKACLHVGINIYRINFRDGKSRKRLRDDLIHSIRYNETALNFIIKWAIENGCPKKGCK